MKSKRMKADAAPAQAGDYETGMAIDPLAVVPERVKGGQHSPSPWKCGGRGSYEIYDSTGHVVCRVNEFNHQMPDNIITICAAPALLAALKEVLETCQAGVIQRNETGKPQWSALDHMGTIARAALAQAERGN